MCISCNNHSTNWLYSTIDNTYIFNARVFYTSDIYSTLDESYDLFFNLLSLNINQWLKNTTKASIFIDLYMTLKSIEFPLLSEWSRHIFNSSYSSVIYSRHPELIFIESLIINNMFISTSSSLYVSLFNYNVVEGLDLTLFVVFHYILVLLLLSFIIVFYVSYYTNSNDDLLVDLDYSTSSLLVEAEKEITAIDDLLMALVTIVFLFGWFFYINVFSFLSFNYFNNTILIFLPLFFYILVGIPTILIYDFGVYFLVYLRGASATSLFLFELIYDYVAALVFYIRILVQNIRLVFMFFTLISLHDIFIFFSLNSEFIFKNSYFNESNNLIFFNEYWSSYSYLTNLLNKIATLIYEILHTYFIVMVQFISFFAIVFWLFLFLYTFFVLEKHENYFSLKRAERAALFKELSIS